MTMVRLGIVPLVIALSGCYHVTPLTETQWGAFIDQRIIASSVLLHDNLIESRVVHIGRRVAAVSDCPEQGFSFRIVIDPIVNAFTLPGGYVYVTSNLLAFVENEGQLAAVLAHEVAHSCARDLAKQAVWAEQKNAAITTAAILASAAAGTAVQVNVPAGMLLHAETRLLVNLAGMFASNLGSMTIAIMGETVAKPVREGYGDEAELEADQLARAFLQRAGYKKADLGIVLGRLLEVAVSFEAQAAGIDTKGLTGRHLTIERTHFMSTVTQLRKRIASLN